VNSSRCRASGVRKRVEPNILCGEDQQWVACSPPTAGGECSTVFSAAGSVGYGKCLVKVTACSPTRKTDKNTAFAEFSKRW
jgi:hypothetical protein